MPATVRRQRIPPGVLAEWGYSDSGVLNAPIPYSVPKQRNGIIKCKNTLLLFITLGVMLLSLSAQAATTSRTPSWATLAQQAQREIKNGGVYSRRWGAASPKMKSIITSMIYSKFGHGYIGKRMWCYANRESGLNPIALSSTGDHSTFQFNYYAHHNSLDFGRLDKPDVAYSIEAAYRMSGGGTKTSPWSGGSYSCPRGNEP
jgi:hypothetical protein